MGNSPSYVEASPPLKVASSPTFGNYLTDGAGRALYIFTSDPADTSSCFGDCLVKWPIYAPMNFQASMMPGISSAMLGQTASGQLTFNHWPLYYYYLDVAAGDTNGQTVNAKWYLLRPDGHPIVTQPPATQTPVATPAASDENWKNEVDQQSFVEYYRWKKWRNYANSHDSDWQDRKAFQKWNGDYWYPNYDKISGAYGRWQKDYNPHDYHDWQMWQKWSN